jgi:hypothetical protein
MKNFRNLCFLIFFLKLFNTAFAGQMEISVLKVINEPDENTTHTIFLILDSNGEILKFKREGPSDNQIYDFKKIIEGTVLFEMEKREVLFLECPNCDFLQGGEIMIRYLKNGITNQYSEIFLDLLRKNEKWALYKADGPTPIRTIKLKANKLLGKVIGIKEIEILSR